MKEKKKLNKVSTKMKENNNKKLQEKHNLDSMD